GFKVCVMAEILGQVSAGIGRQMNIGRLNLDLASVFGWTLWLILISYGLQKIIEIVQKITYRKST
ncbi:MAG: ABC transporter permease, partial [Erysipelotrichaceae bacterium]|nr:ABC transporter permease [Erysipelotrichaceae bacterium]